MMRDDEQTEYPRVFPPQTQPRPGDEWCMYPRPVFRHPNDRGSGKLQGRVALITGGDSGIGRAVAVAFAREGADVVLTYLCEHTDAFETKRHIEQYGRRCLTIAADLRNAEACRRVVEQAVQAFDRLDVLVNNAAVQYAVHHFGQVSNEQMEETFRVNLFAPFFLTQAALPHLKRGSSIINNVSVVAFRGYEFLIEYSASKGALVAFTRSLALALADRGIRVNNVAPGPIWTPLTVTSFPIENIATWGIPYTALRRSGQPVELAAAFVYLASDDSSYVTGHTIHVNGGVIVNS